MRHRDDWFDAEPSMRRTFVRELQRLARRAKARPIPVLLIAGLLTAGLVKFVASRGAVYDARIILKAYETEISEEREPLPMEGLRDYIANLSFSRENLLGIIEELDLFPARATKGDDWAVAELRDGIEVEVYRNFFTGFRNYGDAPRSARIAILYYHPDPEVSYRLAKRLSELVVESENERRQRNRAEALRKARALVDRARRQISERDTLLGKTQLDLAEAEAEGDTRRAAPLRYEVLQLQRSLSNDRDLLQETLRDLRMLEMSHAMAERQLGLRFEVVDERIPEPIGSRRVLLIAIGIGGFLVLLPLCAITLGAFDSRVHEREDVTRLGLPVVGHIPRFEGDRVGSMKSRSARRDRVT